MAEDPKDRTSLRRMGRRGVLMLLLAAPAARVLAAPPARAATEPPADPNPPPEAFPAPVATLLHLPRSAAGGPLPVVVLLHDTLGADPRALRSIEQLLGAGIAVLELREGEDRPEAIAAVAEAAAADGRFDPARIGVLGFGQGAATAARLRLPFAARALLYPGCGPLAAAPPQDTPWRDVPVLILHGTADPVNPPALCETLRRRLAAAGAIATRQTYPAAGYAWDHPAFGGEGVVLLPAPGGGRVAARPWPELAALSAAHVASFFARELGR